MEMKTDFVLKIEFNKENVALLGIHMEKFNLSR